MTSFWITGQTFYEARIHGGDVSELIETAQLMMRECTKENGDSGSLAWRIEGDVLVLRFPGGMTTSLGWDPTDTTGDESNE